MPQLNVYCTTNDLQLGTQHNARVPETDQIRQRREVDEILKRLSSQPGVILADEVGMGNATRLIKVKKSIHKFLGELLWAKGEQSASEYGKDIWRELLKTDPTTWKDVFNDTLLDERYKLTDDPVPKAVVNILKKGEIGLKRLAETLSTMPIRSMSKGSDSERIADVRSTLKEIEENVWKKMIARARWRSPLLVIDEAHHLKNPSTRFAKQLQSLDVNQILKTGDGAMSRVFDRMLFLTATPFQLGHQELVQVLERFGDVRWDQSISEHKESFASSMKLLQDALTESQRAAITLQKSWASITVEDLPHGISSDDWWETINESSSEQLSPRQRGLIEAFQSTSQKKSDAEKLLKPWIVRHNKKDWWPVEPKIRRRQRYTGSGIVDHSSDEMGLGVPDAQMLPFYLAARSAVSPGKDLLGEALCSSYEAFRKTRHDRKAERDEQEVDDIVNDFSHSDWYLSEFDLALEQCSGNVHPKVAATVKRVVDLWEDGEKILVFAFYRHTCRALRLHISNEIERRIMILAKRRFAGSGQSISDEEVEKVLDRIQRRYMDDTKSPGRRALDEALYSIVDQCVDSDPEGYDLSSYRDELVEIMRRFLRVTTTLVRCFPIHQVDEIEPKVAVLEMLSKQDGSGHSWQDKFEGFLIFLIHGCSSAQRVAFLDSAERTTTRAIRVSVDELGEDIAEETQTGTAMTLANVQLATGQTKNDQRSRLMMAFNTPFFPDVFVCSEVMSEGVDLHRYCRYVIHHDLAWNPSQIEQRTGRIDRLGCKAENRHPIHVYLPFVAGASDERQYRVISDREQWFRIVMGQDEVAKLIPQDADENRPPLPSAFTDGLTFQLGLPSE